MAAAAFLKKASPMDVNKLKKKQDNGVANDGKPAVLI